MTDHQTLLCRYHYDPLDRLSGAAVVNEADTQLFYRRNRLVTQIQGALHASLLRTADGLLAQQQGTAGGMDSTLLATDPQHSVLRGLPAGQALVYTAYGYHRPGDDPPHLPGFNGEHRDPVTGHYLLGNGYRAFNPVLMRFNSPDIWSPFGAGGLNAYAYCQGDPVNFQDVTGATRTPPMPIAKSLGKPLSRGKRPSLAQVARKIIDAKKLDRALEQFLDNEQALLNKYAPAPSSPRAGSSSSATVQSSELAKKQLASFLVGVHKFERKIETGPGGREFIPLAGRKGHSLAQLRGNHSAGEHALKLAEHYRYTSRKKLQIKYLVSFLRAASTARDYDQRHEQAYGVFDPRRQ